MSYYPKSQIKTNLYTNGKEYVLSTNKNSYKGYYYELSNGDKFTGKTPEDGEDILLETIILLMLLKILVYHPQIQLSQHKKIMT